MDEEQTIDTVNGKVSLKKKLKQRRKVLIGDQLQDFARNTTLHGLRYITERGVTLVEKIFWLTLFLLSVGICAYQIRNVWIKRQTSPVIVSMSERLVPVTEVPFPSVTICPQWKIHIFQYDYYTEKKKIIEGNFSNMSEEARKKVEDVTLVCDKELAFDLVLLNRNYSDVGLVDNIVKALRYNEYILQYNSECYLRQNEFNCRKILKKVLTEEGVCYNFNGLPFKDIFRTDQIQKNYRYIGTNNVLIREPGPNEDFSDDTSSNTYPIQGRENGARPDLVITFQNDKSTKDKECNALYSGYKVYVHHPSDMPQSSLYYYAILPDQTSSFALKYSVMTTSDDLKEYSPEMRHCYFTGERELRYFKIYTENNCRLECLSNYTYAKCGCVGFFMPHNTSDRICTIQSWDCMKNVLDTISAPMELNTGQESNPCNCLPACNYVEYEAEVLKTEFNVKAYISRAGRIADLLKNATFSRLEMFFKSPRSVAMRRAEIFGRTDFIANSGGLLGLFLGFSFLSLVEIIYFITLRIWCTFKRDLEEDKEDNVRKIQD